MKITNSTSADIPKIFELYRIATAYMQSKNQVSWPEFSKELIQTEINENRQWKLLLEGEIACIWATTQTDALIWGAKDLEPSLYLHRIATNPHFRGRNLVKQLIDWANGHGKAKGLTYLRMDTVGLNKGLIGHYKKLGFQFLGAKKLDDTNGLPAHYQEGEVCLFQKDIV